MFETVTLFRLSHLCSICVNACGKSDVQEENRTEDERKETLIISLLTSDELQQFQGI